MVYDYDIIVFGGGIAGLWLANVLLNAGFNVILIEKDKLGAGQTLASQGMIHGGQKYVLEGALTRSAAAILHMPQRWDACLEGRGEIDLTAVRVLSDTQVMWPAARAISVATVFAAAKLVNANTTKLARSEYPQILREHAKNRGPVYRLPEKVLDMRSLLAALAKPLRDRVFMGEPVDLRPDGTCAVAGHRLRAQLLIFTAGLGNEGVPVPGEHAPRTQRRPLRQVMVRPMPLPLFGHGIAVGHAPRMTVTTHADHTGYSLWYLGGNIAERGAEFDGESALQFARAELSHMFPGVDWTDKEWATWYAERAEPLDAQGRLPAGPHLEQHDRIVVAWPIKLTFAPALADRAMALITSRGMRPGTRSPPPPLPAAELGSYPWELAAWRTIV